MQIWDNLIWSLSFSDLFLGGLVHEGLGSFYWGKQIGEVIFVLYSSALTPVIELSGPRGSTDLLCQGFTIERCFQILIFLSAEFFNSLDGVATLLLLFPEVVLVLVDLVILVGPSLLALFLVLSPVFSFRSPRRLLLALWSLGCCTLFGLCGSLRWPSWCSLTRLLGLFCYKCVWMARSELSVLMKLPSLNWLPKKSKQSSRSCNG